MVQFPMEDVARIGLLKMDFLGLANLTILGKAKKSLKNCITSISTWIIFLLTMPGLFNCWHREIRREFFRWKAPVCAVI